MEVKYFDNKTCNIPDDIVKKCDDYGIIINQIFTEYLLATEHIERDTLYSEEELNTIINNIYKECILAFEIAPELIHKEIEKGNIK